jgi:hypothetical protein
VNLSPGIAAQVDDLHRALETNPGDPSVLERIEDLHRGAGDDDGWVRSLRRAVKVASDHDDRDLAVLAWVHLAEVYLTQFGDRDQGADALEQAARLDPADATRHEVLVELWSRPPARPDRVAAHHRALVGLDPGRVASLRALFENNLAAGAQDAAFCCAEALSFLGRADTAVLEIVGRLRPRTAKLPQRALTPEEWRRGILLAEHTNTVAAVFSVLAGPVADLYKVDLRARLSADDRVDVASTPLAFARRFAAAANALAVPLPEVYRWRGGRGVEFLHAGAPVLLAGEDLMAGRDDAELLFVAGRHLAYLRPECYLLRVLRGQLPTLRAIFLGSLQIALPAIELPVDDARLVDPLYPRLEKALGPKARAAIAALVPRFQQLGGVVDLERFTVTAESAANRAGLLLAGELQGAIAALLKETPLSPAPLETQASTLVGYAVSEPYAELRAALGLAVA